MSIIKFKMISNFNAKEHKTEFVLYVNKYYYKK